MENNLLSNNKKFLLFVLGKSEYLIGILKVRDIIRIMDITEVPNTPDYMKGIINLRGKIIPVIDLRLKFGMQATEYTAETSIIIVEIKNVLIGVIVDSVLEVITAPEEKFSKIETLEGSVNTDFILGATEIDNKIKILLDIDLILSTSDIVNIESKIR